MSYGLYIDLTKAFDSIPHNFLLDKLIRPGISLCLVKIIKKFLYDRTHCTRVGSKLSGLLKISSGVPQFNTVASYLFNRFINDLLENGF